MQMLTGNRLPVNYKLHNYMYKTFEEVFSFSNLYTAAKKCCKGVRWKSSTQKFENNMLKEVYKIYRSLNNRTWKSKGWRSFTLRERGKVRNIQSLNIRERVVQKCFCDNYLTKLFENTFIYDNGACLKGRGLKFTIKRLKYHLNKNKCNYILITDIRKFFESIEHNLLVSRASSLIADDRLYMFYKYLIELNKGSKGLNLGSQISQISASYYLSQLDHFIKDNKRVKLYGRYMDDAYIFGDKEELVELKNEINEFCNKIKLNLSKNKTQIIKLTKGFTFCKRRFVSSHNSWKIKPYKKNILRYVRKVRSLKNKGATKEKLNELKQAFENYLSEFNYKDRGSKCIN